MIVIESLKDYLGHLSKEDFMNLSEKIYMLTISNCIDYPNYHYWFFNKQLPGVICSPNRDILFVRNPENSDEIIAMACLKKDEEEKKICTIYVADKYRALGIGSSLTMEAMKWLKTTKPFITMSEYKLDMFRPIIEKYNWELSEIVSGFYNDRFSELCFNGTLTKNIEPIKTQLQRRLIKVLNNRVQKL